MFVKVGLGACPALGSEAALAVGPPGGDDGALPGEAVGVVGEEADGRVVGCTYIHTYMLAIRRGISIGKLNIWGGFFGGVLILADQRWLRRFLRTERAGGSIGGIGTRVVLNMRQARERRRGFRRGSWRGGSEWLRGGVAWTIGVPGGVLVNGRRGRESSGPRWECRV